MRQRFHSFFGALDNLKNSRLLYLSSVGIEAVKKEDTPMSKTEPARDMVHKDPYSDGEVSGAEEG